MNVVEVYRIVFCLALWFFTSSQGEVCHGGPGVAVNRNTYPTRAVDHRPSPLDREDYNAYEKRNFYEKLTLQEKHAFRRRAMEKELVCTDNGKCFVPGLQVSLLFGGGLSFCVNCKDPYETGSFIDAWDAHFGPPKFHVDGRVRIAVPNDGASEILNWHQIHNNIALVFRCNRVPILEKIKRLQDVGAIAVIVIDRDVNGCERPFKCGGLGERPADKVSIGFGNRDLRDAWRKIFIPSVLIHAEDGKRLLRLLDTQTFETETIGKYVMVRETPEELDMIRNQAGPTRRK